MKKVTYIKTSWCPYCEQADHMLADLKANVERYRDVEIEIIDEDKNPAEAARYEYHLVPNFWIEGRKILEGIPQIETIRQVLDLASIEPKSEKAWEKEPEQEWDEDAGNIRKYSC